MNDPSAGSPRVFRHWMKRAWGRHVLRLPRRGAGTRISRRARIEEAQNVYLGRGCRIDEHAFLSAPGPTRIELGDGVEIRPYVFLETQGGGFIRVGARTAINPFSLLYGFGGLTIGADCMIAGGAILVAASHHAEDTSRPMIEQGSEGRGIEIGDDVWLGAGVRVLDGVRIGSGTIVGAGAVVTESLPGNSIAAGVPARVVRSR
ncbi:MAG: acyltransferase [Acidobacteriota bacterium]